MKVTLHGILLTAVFGLFIVYVVGVFKYTSDMRSDVEKTPLVNYKIEMVYIDGGKVVKNFGIPKGSELYISDYNGAYSLKYRLRTSGDTFHEEIQKGVVRFKLIQISEK